MAISKKNIKPLIGSILVAILLWVLVATDNNYDYQITIPIELVRLAPGKTLSQPIPKQAQVEIRGKGRSLLVVWFYDLRFRLDFPELKTGKTIELDNYLNTIDIPGALNIEILSIIEPKTIELKIDELVEEKKPVMLAGDVRVADGYVLIGYKFEPDSVVIAGPQRLVGQVNSINTRQIDIAAQKNGFSETLNLKNPNPDLIDLKAETVSAMFTIQRLVERVIYDIPIKIVNVPRTLSVEPIPQKMALRIKGGEEIVANIRSDEILAEINFGKQYKPEREEYGAEIITPRQVNWIESIPKKFRLKIKRK